MVDVNDDRPFIQQVAEAFASHERAVIKAELRDLLRSEVALPDPANTQRINDLFALLVGPYDTQAECLLGLVEQLT